MTQPHTSFVHSPMLWSGYLGNSRNKLLISKVGHKRQGPTIFLARVSASWQRKAQIELPDAVVVAEALASAGGPSRYGHNARKLDWSPAWRWTKTTNRLIEL